MSHGAPPSATRGPRQSSPLWPDGLRSGAPPAAGRPMLHGSGLIARAHSLLHCSPSLHPPRRRAQYKAGHHLQVAPAVGSTSPIRPMIWLHPIPQLPMNRTLPLAEFNSAYKTALSHPYIANEPTDPSGTSVTVPRGVPFLIGFGDCPSRSTLPQGYSRI